MSLKDEIDLLVRQNETLIQTLALMGARLEASLQMLSAISSLTAVPVTAETFTEAADRILETLILELTDVEASSILQYYPEENVLRLTTAKGQADVLCIVEGRYNRDLSFKPGEGIAGRVFETGNPIYWDRHSPESERLKRAPNLATPASLACLPLIQSNHKIGVLNISFGEIKPFDPPRKRSLIILSQVVANVLRSFQLKSELEDATHSLRLAQAQLEDRFQRRTAELNAAHGDLERKSIEVKSKTDMLMESEERYRSLVERTSDGFFIFEADSGQFMFLNQRICDLLGYSVAEGLDRTFWEAVVEDEKALVRRRLEERIDGVPQSADVHIFQARRKDGSCFLAQVSSSVISYQGRRAVQGVIKDVTEQERLRQQMQQSQKMEALGTLAGGIAHDFNNILSAMMGYTELALKGMPPGTRTRRHLEQVVTAGLRARDLVRQILSFSRQTASERRPVYIQPILGEALKLLRATLPSTIDIQVDIAPENLAVFGDPTQIHQVIMNLGTNAGQAMRQHGGVLTMRLEESTLRAGPRAVSVDLPSGPYMVMSVADTGEGIPVDVLPRIFEPYFTTKSPEHGTGLGLAVVHGIVRDHGGAVTVDSRVGQGATFRIYLPALVDGLDALSDGCPAKQGNGERILFVDDEPALVDLGRQMLMDLGYNVVSLVSSREALHVFTNDPDGFDMVITDHIMPELTGMDLSQEILAMRPEQPIILLTGFSEHITEERARCMGIRSFIMKPLVAGELAKVVQDALRC